MNSLLQEGNIFVNGSDRQNKITGHPGRITSPDGPIIPFHSRALASLTCDEVLKYPELQFQIMESLLCENHNKDLQFVPDTFAVN